MLHVFLLLAYLENRTLTVIQCITHAKHDIITITLVYPAQQRKVY